MVNGYFIKLLHGKQSFYNVFSNDSYDRLKFYILVWLGLNLDYAPEVYAIYGSTGSRVFKRGLQN